MTPRIGAMAAVKPPLAAAPSTMKLFGPGVIAATVAIPATAAKVFTLEFPSSAPEPYRLRPKSGVSIKPDVRLILRPCATFPSTPCGPSLACSKRAACGRRPANCGSPTRPSAGTSASSRPGWTFRSSRRWRRAPASRPHPAEPRTRPPCLDGLARLGARRAGGSRAPSQRVRDGGHDALLCGTLAAAAARRLGRGPCPDRTLSGSRAARGGPVEPGRRLRDPDGTRALAGGASRTLDGRCPGAGDEPELSPERSGRPSSPESLLRLRLLHDRDPHAHWELWRSQHGSA